MAHQQRREAHGYRDSRCAHLDGVATKSLGICPLVVPEVRSFGDFMIRDFAIFNHEIAQSRNRLTASGTHYNSDGASSCQNLKTACSNWRRSSNSSRRVTSHSRSLYNSLRTV